MSWLTFPIVFLFVLAASFGSLFFSPVWERRRKRNEDIDDIREVLPGLDCGLCGSPNCRLYACNLVLNHGDPSLCAPGGDGCEQKLRQILGGDRREAKVAFVRCAGTLSAAKQLYEYDGRENCAAAASLFGGLKSCPNACLGFGSCVSACSFRAISLVNGVARVDPDLCSGCGKCVSVCPHGVISLIPASARWQVACNSKRPAALRADDCKAACTGCGRCAKLSSSWEFSITDNLAVASNTVPENGPGAGSWAAIASQCPTGAIVHTGRRPAPEAAKSSAKTAKADQPAQQSSASSESAVPSASSAKQEKTAHSQESPNPPIQGSVPQNKNPNSSS